MQSVVDLAVNVDRIGTAIDPWTFCGTALICVLNRSPTDTAPIASPRTWVTEEDFRAPPAPLELTSPPVDYGAHRSDNGQPSDLFLGMCGGWAGNVPERRGISVSHGAEGWGTFCSNCITRPR